MADSGIESAETVTPVTARRNTKAAEAAQVEAERKSRTRKTTLCCLPGGGSDDSSDDKWANKGPIFLFVGLCLLIFVILCCVYGLRLGRGHHQKHQSLENIYTVGDPVYAKDLWLIIELQSDSRGRRTHLGQATAAHVCAAIQAGQKIGWTPLLVGGKSRCCRSRCRNLHPRDLEKMKYASSAHLAKQDGNFQMGMKTAAFLAAIKRGAHFIFHSNPEVYYWAGVSAEDFQRELEYELQKMTIGISVGLVKQANSSGPFPTNAKLVNPYVHFGEEAETVVGSNDDEAARFSYKLCEIRPPSIEKFLETNRLNLDASAPAVIYPGADFRAPFDSRNTVFARDAFWSLLLLPESGANYVASHDEELESEEEVYLLRGVIAQQILGEIGGSTKFSVARQKADRARIGLDGLKSSRFERMLAYANNWFCSEQTVLQCYKSFTDDLISDGLLAQKNTKVVDLWISDLKAVGYEDIPTSNASPCIGDNALEGVYFHPHAVEESRAGQTDSQKDESGGDLMAPRGGKSLPDIRIDDDYVSKQIKLLCPAVDTTELAIFEDLHEDILLIITFYRKEYHNIPLLEIMYRPHFKNILYCGEPDEIVDEYMEHYSGIQGRHFSFLPTHSHTGYECILGSIEMGYHVNGFLLINQDTLINSWNFKDLDHDVIWHGNEHAQAIRNDNIVDIDPPRGEKIMHSAIGILKSFEFLEEVLLGHTKHVHPHTANTRSRHGKSLEEPDFRELLDGHRRNRRSADDLSIEDDFEESAEELELIGEDHDPSKRGSDVMSITDDLDTEPMLASKEWHVALFGEIKHDDEADPVNPDRDLVRSSNATNVTAGDPVHHSKFRNVSEILFHPSNFDTDAMDSAEAEMSDINMESNQFEQMIFNIQKIYKKINSKLQLWLKFIARDAKMDKDEMMKELAELQCDVSSNAEICQIVAHFFNTLEMNEADGQFKLYFDDLPIYYVPASHKDKLYLMANVLTKFQVADELAFPLLLRGLTTTDKWVNLRRSEVVKPPTRPVLSKPQDLLSGALDDIHAELDTLEAAHYLYPVNMTNEVLHNEGLRNVICRNF